MKRILAALSLLVAAYAFAGDNLIGNISVINATKSNCAQSPDGGANSWDGGVKMPFPITPGALLTIQCDVDMYIATDKQSATANDLWVVAAPNTFLTSVSGQNSAQITRVGPDTMKTACVAILPVVTDGGTHTCKVFERNGKE